MQARGEGGAALLFNWETLTLEVIYEALDPATMQYSLSAPTARQVGGPIDGLAPGESITIRVRKWVAAYCVKCMGLHCIQILHTVAPGESITIKVSVGAISIVGVKTL